MAKFIHEITMCYKAIFTHANNDPKLMISLAKLLNELDIC